MNKNIFHHRRQNLLKFLKTHNAVAIVSANPLAHRNDDVHYHFRQDSNFFYLTGFDEPEAILVLHPGKPGEECSLFLRPKDKTQETWEGIRLGVEQAPETLGIDKAYPISEFESKALSLLPNLQTLYVDFTRSIPLPSGVELLEFLRVKFDLLRRSSHRAHGMRLTGILDLQEALGPLRVIKDELELENLKRAQFINDRAHRLAMAYARPDCFEYQIEGLLLAIYRHHGAKGVAYPPIVASGPNALILHHVENQRQMKAGDLVLLDAGPEVNYYASDITRTFPVSGKFSGPQKDIYQIVLAANLAVEKMAQAGKSLRDLHQESVKTLTQGLIDLKILKGDLATELEAKNYLRYFMHGNGHFLGLDVHDVEIGHILNSGCVITNEPGLYIPEDDSGVDQRFRGIGIRIEDDLLIQDKGNVNLSSTIPKTINEVEDACALNWKDLWNQWVH